MDTDAGSSIKPVRAKCCSIAQTRSLRTLKNSSRAQAKRWRARRNIFPGWSRMPRAGLSGASDRRSAARAVRGFTGLVLAAGVFAAAIVSQSSYGDTAKHIVARWTPRLATTASPPPDEPGLPAQLSPRIAEANAAQIAVPPQSSPQDAAPAAAPVPPELTQLLQSMARDIAALGQGIEELKTRQDQMARDNASAVEQLKAGQDQMARAVAKVSETKASETKASDTKASETKTFDAKVSGARASNARASNANASAQNVRPRTSAPPPASRTHRPVPARPSTPATGAKPRHSEQF